MSFRQQKRKRNFHTYLSDEQVAKLQKINHPPNENETNEQDHDHDMKMKEPSPPPLVCDRCFERKELNQMTENHGKRLTYCYACKYKYVVDIRNKNHTCTIEDTHEIKFTNCNTCVRTLQFMLSKLFRRAKQSAAYRSKVDQKLGHTSHTRGDFTITMEDLHKKWFQQEGKCAISGLPMQLEFKHRELVSIERKDPSKGYTKENCIFICVCFNSFMQINQTMLYYILHHQEIPYTPEEIQELPLMYMAERMYSQAKHHSKEKKMNSSITIQDILDQFQKQKGQCAYSGLRLRVHQNSPNFIASIERLNRNEEYTKENIALIIKELNTGGYYDNIDRKYIDSVRVRSSFPYMPPISELEALYHLFQHSTAFYATELKCNDCSQIKPINKFRSSVLVRQPCIACAAKQQVRKVRQYEPTRICNICNKEKDIVKFVKIKEYYKKTCKKCSNQQNINRKYKKIKPLVIQATQ